MSKESDFTSKRAKPGSISDGFIADKESETYILKKFFSKNGSHGLADRAARREAVAELVASSFFQEMLQDKAPDIALVEAEDRNIGYLSSKFFKDFQTLSEFTSGKDATSVNPSNSKIRDIRGLEEVISACVICGEADIHAGNLGIVPVKNGRWQFITY